MATYKVIQDIEAEDKLVGPFSLRQFVYAAIVVVCGFIAFKLFSIAWWLIFPFLPPMIFFGFLAAPFTRDQPSEVWLLAKIRFILKPRRRIWDQSGMSELVTITVPKKIERHLTNNLSQVEVRSRLQALADTIDSRGWAIKNVNVNMFSAPAYAGAGADTDRLVEASTLPQEVSGLDITLNDDMLDERMNPRAQQLSQMIDASSQAHRQQVMAMMQQGGTPPAPQPTPPSGNQPSQSNAPDYWFLNSSPAAPQDVPPGYATFGSDPFVTPTQATPAVNITPPVPQQNQAKPEDADEEALLRHIREEKARPDPMHSKLKTILPLREQQQLEEQQRRETEARAAVEAEKSAMTPPADPAILDLANNDDLNIATIAREADKRTGHLDEGDEVVISLH